MFRVFLMTYSWDQFYSDPISKTPDLENLTVTTQLKKPDSKPLPPHLQNSNSFYIKECRFYTCTSKDGGAISFREYGSLLTENCVFSQCTANNGGAIFAERTNVALSNICAVQCFSEMKSHFGNFDTDLKRNNKLQLNYVSIADNGQIKGDIILKIEKMPTTFKKSNISNNLCDKDCIISFSAPNVQNSGALTLFTMEYSSVSGNSGEKNAIIEFLQIGSKDLIKSCNFIGNKHSKGVIHSNFQTVDINDCYILNNTAVNVFSAEAAANININDCFVQSDATFKGKCSFGIQKSTSSTFKYYFINTAECVAEFSKSKCILPKCRQNLIYAVQRRIFLLI